MNTLLRSLMSICLGIFLLSSCTSTTEPNGTATLLTLNQIRNNDGYDWLHAEKT